MNRYTVIFHTPVDISVRRPTFFDHYIVDHGEMPEKLRKAADEANEILRRVSRNAASMNVDAEDVDEAVAKAHKCIRDGGEYEYVLVIDGLSVVAEYRHRVSVNKTLDRII